MQYIRDSPQNSWNRLSVLIFSFNRHDFLRRQIIYWSDKPVDLLIADGSECPMVLPEIVQGGQFRFIYHHAPEPGNVNLRMKWLASTASTPYVVFLDDQDMFLWSAATRQMEFLDCNPQYCSVSGFYWVYSVPYRYWTYRVEVFDIDDNGVGGRVMFARAGQPKHVHLAYSLMRVEPMRLIYDARPVVDFEYEVPSDLFFLIAPLVAGKHRCLEVPALWRSDGSQSRQHWRSDLQNYDVFRGQRQLDDALEGLFEAFNVEELDRELVRVSVRDFWGHQELRAPQNSSEPTWLAARIAEIKSFTRVRSRIREWMRKDGRVEPLEVFARSGGLQVDQLEDLRNVHSILFKYPDGVLVDSGFL